MAIKICQVDSYDPSVNPKPMTITCPQFSDSHINFITKLTAIQEPTTYIQAKEHPQWVQAMEEELNALEQNDTWELVSLSDGK